MNRRVCGLAIALLMAGPAARAAELSATEAKALRTEIADLMQAFESGNADAFVDQTHISLQQLAGGREAFTRLTRSAVEQLRATGLKFVSAEVGKPTRTYVAGTEEVCFVPRVSVMELQGQQMRSTTYMIAIRKRGGHDWTFLDGAGLRNNPALLPVLLPELDPGVELPPNKIEEL